MNKVNTWYTLAVRDNRRRYRYRRIEPIKGTGCGFSRDLQQVIKWRDKYQSKCKQKLIILKRTCLPLEI